ncbi:MAG: lipid II flippase MurJ [Thermodesulfovibrionales bacterium]
MSFLHQQKEGVAIHWVYLKKELVRDIISTTAWSTVSKGIGFLVPFFIAAWFGVTSETDAFFFAYSLILLLVTIFSPTFESIIVPFIAEFKAKGEDVEKFIARLFGISGIGLGVITLFFFAIIYPILPIVTKFSREELNLVFVILLESSPLIILIVWTSIMAGTLNAYKLFSIPALSPAFRAIITLTFIFSFKDKIGIHSIALGYVMGEIFRLFVLSVLMKRYGIFRFRLSISLDPKLIDFLKTLSYQIMGMTVLVFTPVINKTMASHLGSGNVSLLEYSERLYMIPVTFLISGFVAFLSHWSEGYYITNDKTKIKEDVKKALIPVGILAFTITVLLYLLRDFVVNIVYGYGKFPKEQLIYVKDILGFYLIGLTPYFLGQVYVRAFWVQKNTSILFFTALFMIAGTVAFNILFIRFMGVSGIAMGNSMVSFLSLGVLSLNFYRRLK